jgi:nudix-type nucleoside diphosphatase (YffH/AdpP family)
MAELIRKDILYRGWSELFAATVRLPDGTEAVREVEHHGDAAAVLPYDPERNVALLVRQPRAPVILRGEAALLEAPAGRLEPGEAPEDCVRREAMEEVGVRLSEVTFVAAPFAMPAVSTERIHLFLARYSADDRVAEGGGAEGEQENITVSEEPLPELWRRARAGEIADSKTLILLYALWTEAPDALTD